MILDIMGLCATAYTNIRTTDTCAYMHTHAFAPIHIYKYMTTEQNIAEINKNSEAYKKDWRSQE